MQAKGHDVTAMREESEYEHVSAEDMEDEFFEPGVDADLETGESPDEQADEEKLAG